MVIKRTEIQRRFGRRIQELRYKKGMTSQMSLANKAGLDRTYIGGIERGERNVGLVNIQKIAKALDVSIEELFRF
jgi:transcriptional regulator with XRE-family HTH domain